MLIFTVRRLRDFAAQNPRIRAPLAVWLKIVKSANWETPAQLRQTLGSADFLADNVVIFDLGSFRISAHVRYANDRHRNGRIYVRHVMTHAEYDRRSRAGTL